jgi:hypothetical protein
VKRALLTVPKRLRRGGRARPAKKFFFARSKSRSV